MHTKNYFLSFMVAFVFCWTNLAAQEQPFTYVVATDRENNVVLFLLKTVPIKKWLTFLKEK